MSDKILVITDNSRGGWVNRLAGPPGNRPNEISVLTLGITPNYFIKAGCRRGGTFADCRFVDVDDISEELQKQVRDFYMNFIFELPKKIPQELLFCKGRNLWWFLDMTEKCPVRSRIIYRLFYLELVRSVIAKDTFCKIYVDLDDRLLSETLTRWRPDSIQELPRRIFAKFGSAFSRSFLYFLGRYIKNCSGISLGCLARSILLKINGVKGANPPDRGSLFFFTNYPGWWNNPYKSEASEKFFGSLPENSSLARFAYYAVLLFSLNPLEIFFKRKRLKDFFERKKMFLLEETLTAREKLSVLSFYYLRWASAMRQFFKSSFKIVHNGFDITELVNYEMCYSLSHVELFKDILIERIFGKFTGSYKPGALIYRIEFQPFEKAMLKGIGRECRTVSLQHSTLSKNLISHFFAAGEIAFHLDKNNSEVAMPLPDIMFTAGRYFRDIMVEAGFPSERIEICGPIRYSDLLSYLKQDKNKSDIRKRYGFPESEKIFLVVMNWIEKEGMALISALAEAEKKMDKKFRFVLRSHPHVRYDESILTFLRKSGSKLNYSFLNDDVSLYDAISMSDGIIQVPTTLGYEAMAIGIMPIVYENRHIFNVNSLEELRDCVPVAHSWEELRAAVYSVINGDEKIDSFRSNWPAVLEMFFYDLKNNPQERFAELLKKEGILN